MVLPGWSWHPVVLICLALSAWLYIKGTVKLWHASTRGAGIGTGEAASFVSGWIVMVVALVSPLHELGDELFSAHMVQHELLISVSAPLLVLGRPLIPFLWALPLDWRRTAGRWSQTGVVSTLWRRISNPAVAFALHALALWTWHMPRLSGDVDERADSHTSTHVLPVDRDPLLVDDFQCARWPGSAGRSGVLSVRDIAADWRSRCFADL